MLSHKWKVRERSTPITSSGFVWEVNHVNQTECNNYVLEFLRLVPVYFPPEFLTAFAHKVHVLEDDSWKQSSGLFVQFVLC